MSNAWKAAAGAMLALAALCAAMCVGSVPIPVGEVGQILLHKLFGAALPEGIKTVTVNVLWNIRMPRAMLAFATGAALSMSGCVMQSVMQNPLASGYTLGVSSGASLGAGLVILFGLSIPGLGAYTLPVAGLTFGMASVLLAMAVASRIDRGMQNTTVILCGMVFSLFINGVYTLLSALRREQLQGLVFWQMGSFAMKDWLHAGVLWPVAAISLAVLMRYSRAADALSFGSDSARAVGVDIRKTKWGLLLISSALTGVSVAFSGVIGFIDLIAPHIVRKIFGARHIWVIPMSAIFGGIFMTICDLVARTITSPQELPVGAVTAILGAPFFIYVYFSGRKNAAK